MPVYTCIFHNQLQPMQIVKHESSYTEDEPREEIHRSSPPLQHSETNEYNIGILFAAVIIIITVIIFLQGHPCTMWMKS